ncbi:hypothetical protein ACFLQ0_05930 [Nitrospinota bacterium]
MWARGLVGVPLREILLTIEAGNADGGIAEQFFVDVTAPVMDVESFLHNPGGLSGERAGQLYQRSGFSGGWR